MARLVHGSTMAQQATTRPPISGGTREDLNECPVLTVWSDEAGQKGLDGVRGADHDKLVKLERLGRQRSCRPIVSFFIRCCAVPIVCRIQLV